MRKIFPMDMKYFVDVELLCLKRIMRTIYYKQENWITRQNKFGKNYAKCFALITETNLSRDDTNWIMMKMRLAGESKQSPTLVVMQVESFLKVTEVHLSFRLIISFIALQTFQKLIHTNQLQLQKSR